MDCRRFNTLEYAKNFCLELIIRSNERPMISKVYEINLDGRWYNCPGDAEILMGACDSEYERMLSLPVDGTPEYIKIKDVSK